MKILFFITLNFLTFNTFAWIEDSTEIVECDASSRGKKVSLNFIEEYDNVEDETTFGFNLVSVPNHSPNLSHTEMSVLLSESPITFFGIIENSKFLHLRIIDLANVDLTIDDSILNRATSHISNLSGLKEFGIVQVYEVIIDKKSKKGRVRSLEAIAHNAVENGDILNYELENCRFKNKVLNKYKSKSKKFKSL